MSDRLSDLLIDDILESVAKIASYVEGVSEEDFLSDSKTVDAVVRNLEIVGEAANRLPDDFKAVRNEVPWPQIVGLRHRIVHEYFGVDPKLIWRIVEHDLPQLRSSIEAAGEK